MTSPFPFRILIALLYAFLLLPVLSVALVSLFDSQFLSFPPPGYTLDWYANVFREESFIDGFLTSIRVALIATAIGVSVGVSAALGLVYFEFPGSGILRAFLLAPLMAPGIVIGTSIYIFYLHVAQSTGWNPIRSQIGLIVAHVVLTIPWSVRLIASSLSMLDRSIEEAARNLGASALTTLVRITLPRMRAGIFAAILFCFIVSFENLEVSVFLSSPGTTTLPIAMMQYLEFQMNPTMAAASTLQVLFIGAILLVVDRFVNLSRIV